MRLLLSLRKRELKSQMAQKAKSQKLKAKFPVVEPAAPQGKRGLESLWRTSSEWKTLLTAKQNSVRACLHL